MSQHIVREVGTWHMGIAYTGEIMFPDFPLFYYFLQPEKGRKHVLIVVQRQWLGTDIHKYKRGSFGVQSNPYNLSTTN